MIAENHDAIIAAMVWLLWSFLFSFGVAFAGLAFSLAALLRPDPPSGENAAWNRGALRLGALSLFAALFNSSFFLAWISGSRSWEEGAAGMAVRICAILLAAAAAALEGIIAMRGRRAGEANFDAWSGAAFFAALALLLGLGGGRILYQLAVVDAFLLLAGLAALFRLASPALRRPTFSGRRVAAEAVFPALCERSMALSSLSAREREIVALLNRGLANKEIAYSLKIRMITVKNHVYNIYQKTGVKNRVELLNLLRVPEGEKAGREAR